MTETKEETNIKEKSDEEILHERKIEDLLSSIPQKILFDKLLLAFENGTKISDLREDPTKYLTSGKTKEIVINSGGEGLKLSPEIVAEMAKRGDKLAQEIIKENRFRNYRSLLHPTDLKFAFLEDQHGSDYDRENKILIEIIKEGKFKNNGGMNLRVMQVYEEPFMYKIETNTESFSYGEEYIEGYYKIIAEMKG